MTRAVRLLTRGDVERLLDMRSCIDAVEHAFHSHGEGKSAAPGILGMRADRGGFHIKAAISASDVDPRYFAAKINANFPDNPKAHGLPTIQGLLALFDATTGEPLAVMDSARLTILRTAAASAVAARHLANQDATSVAIIGCGAQALAQLAAVSLVRRVERAIAFDSNAEAALTFARTASEALALPVTPVTDMGTASRSAGIVITCTTSQRAFLGTDDVGPGAFVAAVGADSEHKQEIHPSLMKRSVVVTDSTAQCSTIGDLHHAIAEGAMQIDDVRAELSAVVADPSRGRRSADEVVIFDSTGVAFQDVVAAALVYEAAVREGAGTSVGFAG